MNPSILLIDDDALMREQIIRSLGTDGYQIDTAADGVEAMKKMGQQSYDLLISDIFMPRLNGLDLIEIVLSRQAFLKVIFISVAGEKEEVLKALRLGAIDFMDKGSKAFQAELKSAVHRSLLLPPGPQVDKASLDLKLAVAKGALEPSLDKTIKLLKGKDKDLLNEAINLSSRLKRLHTEQRMDVIDGRSYDQELNRITVSFLSFLDELDPSLFVA